MIVMSEIAYLMHGMNILWKFKLYGEPAYLKRVAGPAVQADKDHTSDHLNAARASIRDQEVSNLWK